MIHNCSDPNCIGTVDERDKLNIREFYPNALIEVLPFFVPCDWCKLLHWLNGSRFEDPVTKGPVYWDKGKITSIPPRKI